MNVDFEYGVQLYNSSRYKDALDRFSKALEASPNDPEILYHQALCYIMLDQYEKAKQIGLSILAAAPDDGYIHFLLSRIYLGIYDLKKAKKHINDAISIYPYEAEFFGQKAALLLEESKHEEGIRTTDEGLAIDPNNKTCLNVKARLLTKLNRVEEASAITENLLDKDPENEFSHANTGWVELENGNHKKAFEHFAEALRLDPTYSYAREGMTTTLKAKNFLYRNYLKYEFWMSKKSSGQQWGVIIVIYLVYRFSTKLLSAADMNFLLIPVIILYMFFALGSWMMEPISNSILLTNVYGRYLLSKNELKSGISFIALLSLAIISLGGYFVLNVDHLLWMSIAFFAALVPVPRSFLKQNQRGRIAGFLTGIIMIAISAVGFLFIDSSIGPSFAIIITLVAYTWISNFIK